MEVADFKTEIECQVITLGKQEIILGIPWLRKEKPDIDWESNTIILKRPEGPHVIKGISCNATATTL